MNMHRHILRSLTCVLLLATLAGCVADPAAPAPSTARGVVHGVFVVNEGVWRHDDATLTYFDPTTGETVNDYFAARNPGLRLGDVANSITVANGRAYISVSTSESVEVIECPGGRWLGRIRMPHGNQPRSVAFTSTGIGLAACFGDSVVMFDTAKLTAVGTMFAGPGPEGIVHAGDYMLVSLSGLGQLRQGEPGAGTLAVLDGRTGGRLSELRIGDNPRSLSTVAWTGRTYVLYGLADSLGGLVEIDDATLREIRRWPVDDAREFAVDDRGEAAFVISKNGVMEIDLRERQAPLRTIVDAKNWPGRIFYSIGLSDADGRLYLATLTNYAAPGEVLVFDRASGELVSRFACGINPGDFAFF